MQIKGISYPRGNRIFDTSTLDTMDAIKIATELSIYLKSQGKPTYGHFVGDEFVLDDAK